MKTLVKKTYRILKKTPFFGVYIVRFKEYLFAFGKRLPQSDLICQLQNLLSPEEINVIYAYWKDRAKSSKKIGEKFQKDIIEYARGTTPLTIEIMDLKQPDIASKLTDNAIEKSALYLRDTSEHTKKEIVEYCDSRIKPEIEERSSKFKSRKKTFSITMATEAFGDAKALLDAEGIPFFLVSGTLLGAIRNGGFMENDYDIDLGFYEHDIALEELKDLVTSSSKFDFFEQYGHYSFAVKHASSGIVIDFFSHFLDHNALCHRSVIHKWYNTPFTLTQIPFAGTVANIPENYNLYLSENYGNWRDRIVYYDFSFDTPNVKYSTTIDALEYFTTRLTKAATNGWRRTFVCANRALKQAFGMDYMRYYPSMADGDVMDNLEPRRQLLVVEGEKTNNIAQFLDSLIDYCEGTNIVLDIAAIGHDISHREQIKDFRFIGKVFSAKECQNLGTEEIYVYDAIVKSASLRCDLLEDYPMVLMDF